MKEKFWRGGGSLDDHILTGKVFPRPSGLKAAKLCPARLDVHIHVLLSCLGPQLHAPPTSRRLTDSVCVADNGQGPPQETWWLRWKLASVDDKRNITWKTLRIAYDTCTCRFLVVQKR